MRLGRDGKRSGNVSYLPDVYKFASTRLSARIRTLRQRCERGVKIMKSGRPNHVVGLDRPPRHCHKTGFFDVHICLRHVKPVSRSGDCMGSEILLASTSTSSKVVFRKSAILAVPRAVTDHVRLLEEVIPHGCHNSKDTLNAGLRLNNKKTFSCAIATFGQE